MKILRRSVYLPKTDLGLKEFIKVKKMFKGSTSWNGSDIKMLNIDISNDSMSSMPYVVFFTYNGRYYEN